MAVGLSKLPKPTSPRTVGGPGFLISWSSLTQRWFSPQAFDLAGITNTLEDNADAREVNNLEKMEWLSIFGLPNDYMATER